MPQLAQYVRIIFLMLHLFEYAICVIGKKNCDKNTIILITKMTKQYLYLLMLFIFVNKLYHLAFVRHFVFVSLLLAILFTSAFSFLIWIDT